MPHFILGTAGHIDHGKSSLVKALTGTDPDRLPEEKARGMTIELGFAHLDLENPEPGAEPFSLGIVDVPGHADFVKNMVAGVGAIDIALIVVAADDSWMPQTEEHVQILTYLEVPRAAVALTKADLVDAETAELAELDIRERLDGTPFAEAPIIPTSAATGAGLPELRAALARLLAEAPPPADIGKPRLSVDRVFSVKGIGTVVTGTLGGGCLKKGRNAVVQPLALETKVRSLQSHKHELDEAPPGTRTAIGLQGIPIATKQEKRGVRRGDTVSIPGLGAAHHTAAVLVRKLDREIAGQPGSLRPLRHGMRVRFHHGGAARSARLFLMDPDNKELAPGRQTLAQIRFDSPAYCFVGDRFVLRDWGMQSTLAGGLVLDPTAARRHYRAPANRACLEAIAANPHDPATHLAAFLARDRMLRRSTTLVQSNFSAESVAEAIQHLIGSGRAAESGDWLLDAAWWREVVSGAAALIDDQHRKKPHLPGLPLPRIASFLAKHTNRAELLDALAASLRAEGYQSSGKFIHRAGHEPKLPPDLARAAESIRRQLAADPLNPPGIKELAATKAADQAFRFLVETGEIIKLDEKVAVSAETWQRLAESIRTHISNKGPATASELRESTGTTRRILIPLLERLDAEKLTIREGDRRRLA